MKNGFFVSCKKGKESKAYKELVTILNSVFQSVDTQPDYTSLNVSLEIENEIKIMKATFFSVYFTYKSIFYVSNTSPLYPSRLFSLLKEKNVLFEYVHRIVPLDRFVTYNEEVFIKCLDNIDKNLSFKIDYEERFAPKDMKNKIFDFVTNYLKGMRVNLVQPDYIILIQVLKTDIGFTVLKDFKDTFNFSKNT